MTEAPEAPVARRRLSMWLLAGIIVMPLIFSWLLLRRGYSNALRVGAFAYAVLGLVLGLARFAEMS